jgi:hypothetical protein
MLQLLYLWGKETFPAPAGNRTLIISATVMPYKLKEKK